MRSVGFIFRFGEDSKNHSLDSRIQFGKHSPLNNSSFFYSNIEGKSQEAIFYVRGDGYLSDLCFTNIDENT